MAERRSSDEAAAREPDDPRFLAQRYGSLGTTGVTVSSDSRADVAISGSPLEGWIIATVLLLASCLAMGIYLLVLHR
ncbi:MAG: hypothetical protein ACYCZN_14030 [Candidatus Dormibacteria bacterium]